MNGLNIFFNFDVKMFFSIIIYGMFGKAKEIYFWLILTKISKIIISIQGRGGGGAKRQTKSLTVK